MNELNQHSRHRILLVDDYALGRKLSVLRLHRAGFEVTTASSGEEALEIAKRVPLDAIVSDIRMTGMDGFELVAAVRSDPALTRIPVVLLSSVLDEQDQQRASTLGVMCVLRTTDFGEALDSLAAALGKRSD